MKLKTKQETGTKRIKIGKDQVKLFLFSDNVILHLKDTIEFTRKHLDTPLTVQL